MLSFPFCCLCSPGKFWCPAKLITEQEYSEEPNYSLAKMASATYSTRSNGNYLSNCNDGVDQWFSNCVLCMTRFHRRLRGTSRVGWEAVHHDCWAGSHDSMSAHVAFRARSRVSVAEMIRMCSVTSGSLKTSGADGTAGLLPSPNTWPSTLRSHHVGYSTFKESEDLKEMIGGLLQLRIIDINVTSFL